MAIENKVAAEYKVILHVMTDPSLFLSCHCSLSPLTHVSPPTGTLPYARWHAAPPGHAADRPPLMKFLATENEHISCSKIR
jgi:hypothetical protein